MCVIYYYTVTFQAFLIVNWVKECLLSVTVMTEDSNGHDEDSNSHDEDSNSHDEDSNGHDEDSNGHDTGQ